MGKRVGMEVSIAAAEAVKLANVDVVAAYPITPQTHVVEKLSDMVANGELNAEYITVESEHSAMSVAIGSQAVGARTFTSTSSQGLALMSELVPIASALRLPIVMLLANRSLSGPLSIWNDHSDVMSVRDSGCIQFFVKNGQETYDSIFNAYKMAENKEVLLPVIINMDGFVLSHTFESVELVDDDLVESYLPPYDPQYVLHPDKPLTMGAFASPQIYTEAKKAHDEAIKASYPYIVEAWNAWGKISGRYYSPVEQTYCEDADTIFVTMGSLSETAIEAVKLLRKEGQKVGLIELRLWRPFPFEDLLNAVKGVQRLIVIDRAISPGGPGGPVASEVRSAMYGMAKEPEIINYIVGLGGRNLSINDFVNMVDLSGNYESAKGSTYEIYGVRG